jgi:hypothetical protein
MRSTQRNTGLAGAVAASVLGFAGISHAASYSMIPIFSPDSTGTHAIIAQGISNSGEVTGWFEGTKGSTPVSFAFAGTPGATGINAVHSIGYDGGNLTETDNGYFPNASAGFGINSAGTVVGLGSSAGDPAFGPDQPTTNGMTTLGDLGGTGSTRYATSINETGYIAGGALDANNRYHAFALAPGQTLANVTTTTVSSAKISFAYGINASETVAGFASTTNIDTGKKATEWIHSVVNGVDTWAPNPLFTNPAARPAFGGTQSVALGVDDAGQAVGVAEYNNANGTGTDAFLEKANGTTIDLSPGSGGATTLANPFSSSGSFNNEYATTYANVLNQNLGNVCGSLAEGSYYNSSTGVTEVIGYTNGPLNGTHTDAALWTVAPDGTVTYTDLQSIAQAQYPGWQFLEATGINSSGDIVGIGFDSNLSSSGATSFELIPQAAVPEPVSGIGMVGAAAGLLLGRRKRTTA